MSRHEENIDQTNKHYTSQFSPSWKVNRTLWSALRGLTLNCKYLRICWDIRLSGMSRSVHTHFGTNMPVTIARSKGDGTRAETRFGLSAKWTSPLKSAGVSVQSTTGSRGVRISGQQLYRSCSDVQCKAAGYPLHSHLSLSLPLPCVTVCHQVPNALNLSTMRNIPEERRFHLQ